MTLPKFHEPCPHPARHGNHEIYLRTQAGNGTTPMQRTGTLFCRACGAEAKCTCSALVYPATGVHSKTCPLHVKRRAPPDLQPHVIVLSKKDWSHLLETMTFGTSHFYKAGTPAQYARSKKLTNMLRERILGSGAKRP